MSSSLPSATLAKITGIYRWSDGAHFDHAYYATEHARLTTALLRPLGLVRFESERVMSTGAPQPGAVVAISNAYFETIAAAQAALAEAGAALAADIPRYTNLRPALHLAQVQLHDR